MIQKVLMVCVGNICRSPMAAALMAEKLKPMTPEVALTSAGIHALVNHPAHKTAQTLMLERGLDISLHKAQQVTPAILFNNDLILTMEARHQKHIEYNLPSVRGRVYRLGHWSNVDIPDPYRQSYSFFSQVLALITQGIDEWYLKLWS